MVNPNQQYSAAEVERIMNTVRMAQTASAHVPTGKGAMTRGLLGHSGFGAGWNHARYANSQAGPAIRAFPAPI